MGALFFEDSKHDLSMSNMGDFQHHSLLPDRKLKFLAQQPLRLLYNSKEAASLLLYWYWEDCLKHRYERFVVALEEATKDTQPFLREKSLKVSPTSAYCLLFLAHLCVRT
jgi:hypothetical protein